MALTLVASARGAFSAAGKTLAIAAPTAAHPGDVLLALVAHGAADGRAATPAGWTLAQSLGAGADVLDVYVHMVGDRDPASVAFALPAAAGEWQAELVALRGTSPGIVVEATATASSAGTTIPTAGVTSQQATSLVLCAWTCAGFKALTVPAGFTAIDSLTTSVVSPRTMMLAYRLAGATGALSFPATSAEDALVGRSFSLVLRDRIPIRPAPLVDLVPGNLGLFGKDTRPPR